MSENENVPLDIAKDAYRIRKATLVDLDTIVTFNTCMAEETENIKLPQETAVAGVRAALEGRAAASYYLLELNGGDVVAQLMITFEWSDWRASDIWWIQSAYVIPAHRRNGYFKALYNHVRQEAQAAKVCGLRLYVDTTNTRAQATYERLGMGCHYKVYEEMFTAY